MPLVNYLGLSGSPTEEEILTTRFHRAPCLLCISGVRRIYWVITMALPIRFHSEELPVPTPMGRKQINSYFFNTSPIRKPTRTFQKLESSFFLFHVTQSPTFCHSSILTPYHVYSFLSQSLPDEDPRTHQSNHIIYATVTR